MSAAAAAVRLFRYRFAGLVHEVDRPLAGLDDGLPADGRLEVRCLPAAAVRETLAGGGDGAAAAWLSPPLAGAAALRPDGGAALVDEAGGAALVRRLTPFASLLQARGVLHASAVAGGGAVAAFLGASGAGKSTLARALERRGLILLADDLLPVRQVGGRLSAPLPETEGDPRFGRLAALFFLERRAGSGGSGLRPLTPADALAALTRNGFGDLASRELWRGQFDLHARISGAVPTFRLALAEGSEALEAAAAEVADRMRSGLG